MEPELIKTLVIIAFIIGLLSFGYALLVVTEENNSLEYAEQKLPEHPTPFDLSSLSDDKVVKDNLIGQRLADLLTAWKGAGEQQDSLPSLQDLHRLSSRRLLTAWAPSMLRLICSVLLIIGICGTLWGVHAALTGSESHILRRLPAALEPSKWAVLTTVLLLCLRAHYERTAEQFLCRMDHLTLRRLLPCLQPQDTMNSALQSFAQEIRAFREGMKAYKEASASMKKFSESFADSSQAVKTLEVEMDHALDCMAQDEGRMKKAQNDLDRHLQEVRNTLNTLSSSVEALSLTQQNVLKVADTLEKPLNELSQAVPKLNAAKDAVINVASQAPAALQAAKSLQELPEVSKHFSAELVNATFAVAQEREQSQRATKRLEGHVYSFRSQVSLVESVAHSMSESVRHVAGAANKLDGAGDEVRRQSQRLSQNADAMEARAAALQEKIESVEQMRQPVEQA